MKLYIQYFSQKKAEQVFSSALHNNSLYSTHSIFSTMLPVYPLLNLLKSDYKAVIEAIEPNITPGKFATTIGQSFFS